MNNDNPYLSSFLASRSEAASEASARQSQESASLADATASSRATAIETIASISSGQTVFITVTREISPTSQASKLTTPNNTPTRKSSSHVGAIAGGVVGGVVAFALAGLLVFLLWRKRRTKETRRATFPPSYADADMSEQIGGKSHSKHALLPQRN